MVPAGRAVDHQAGQALRAAVAARPRHGRALIAHVEAAARRDGAGTLILNVNKRNAKAIAAYRACGFATREAVVADIGGGFVMDDYVMAKAIGPG
ncbi:MAG: GNAT family N-acetyltransferase [Betaproteobacteria bacterium]|nr:GNAT family N-acetyltransferase [Betaproteobacteria bacterium]